MRKELDFIPLAVVHTLGIAIKIDNRVEAYTR
jgi:hypothetical protein